MQPALEALNRWLRRVPPWSLYIAGAFFAGWHFWQGLTGMGAYAVEPVNVLERRYGLTALQLLVAGLAVTPLRQHLGLNLLRYRRQIGLLAFFFALAHFLVWLGLDMNLRWEQILRDLLKRWYIVFGFAGFLLLMPLALTSNNWSIRRLGPLWRVLHRLVYAAVLLGALHFVILVKGYPAEPYIYLGAAVLLLLLRLKSPKPRAAARS